VIGHVKAEGHLGRCHLKGRAGDAANAILAAVGYNFRRILAWLRLLLPLFLIAIGNFFFGRATTNSRLLTDDERPAAARRSFAVKSSRMILTAPPIDAAPLSRASIESEFP
jgi:hypothetical protein